MTDRSEHDAQLETDSGSTGEPPGESHPQTGEDMVESDAPSARTTEIRRRLELLVPANVSRKTLGGTGFAALALGLVAGFLVGNAPDANLADQTATEMGPPPDGRYIPIIPLGDVPLEYRVAVPALGAGSLRLEDLTSLGETALPGSMGTVTDSGLDGLCGISNPPVPVPFPPGPMAEGTVFGSGYVSFILAGAGVTERVLPYLDELAASAQLRGTVEFARTCPGGDRLSVGTEGVATGIGDEYAVFTVSRPDPSSSEIQTSIVVLVRVGGQLIEIALTPEGGTEVPDGPTRALRIAEAAVTRILAG